MTDGSDWNATSSPFAKSAIKVVPGVMALVDHKEEELDKDKEELDKDKEELEDDVL